MKDEGSGKPRCCSIPHPSSFIPHPSSFILQLSWTAPVSRRSKVVNAAGARASISGSWVKGDMILSYLGRCRDLGGRQGAVSCVTCGPVHCDAGGIVGSSVRFDNAVHGPQASGRRLTTRPWPRWELAPRSSRRDPRPDG